MEPLPWVFAVFQYFRKILPLIESLRYALLYTILWAGALLRASDVIQYCGQYGRHLGFYQNQKL